MAKVSDIADAVATALVGQGYTDAARRLVPFADAVQLATRKISVIPMLWTPEAGVRGSDDTSYDIGIAIQKQCKPSSNAECDALLDVAEALITLFSPGDTDGALYRTAMAGAELREPPRFGNGASYIAESLYKDGIFNSLIILTYYVN